MGKQSARIYFRGKDHKEIYYQGHYHDAMYIGSTLVWEKLKTEQPTGTPLEGFSAICYYNGFYYVAYWEIASNVLNRIIKVYQGDSLEHLKFAGEIKTVGSYRTKYPIVVVADQSGFTIASYDGNTPNSVTNYYVFHLNYLPNKELDIDSCSGSGNDSLVHPIQVGIDGTYSQFLYKVNKYYAKTYIGYDDNANEMTYNPTLYGNGTFMYKDSNLYRDLYAVYAYNGKMIMPVVIADEKNVPTMAETNYLYFLVKNYSETQLELVKVIIPYTTMSVLFNKVVQYYEEKHEGEIYKSTPTKEQLKVCFQVSSNTVASNGYLIYQNMPIVVKYKQKNESYKFYVDITVNLRDFSYVSLVYKDESANRKSLFMTEEWAFSVWEDKKGKYIRYTSYPDCDKIIYFENISGDEELDKESVLKPSVFKSAYQDGDCLYCSISGTNDRLLQINITSNTAAVITPQMYVEEETL